MAPYIATIVQTTCLLLFFFCAPVWAKELRINLAEALQSALKHNEIITESKHRVAEAAAMLTSAQGAYDLTVFANARKSAFNALTTGSLSAPAGATRSYLQSDMGLRQRISTGGALSLYYTQNNENRLVYEGSSRRARKNYLTLEFTQSLLRGLGDKEQQGALEKALLGIDNTMWERKLVVAQVVLEVIRAYWHLVLAQESLVVGREIEGMAQEVLRREKIRLSEGLSRGVDVDRALLAVRQRYYTVLQQERDVDVARERLQFLLNDPNVTGDAYVVPVGILTDNSLEHSLPDAEKSKVLAIDSRFELKQINLMLKQLNIDYDTAKNNLLPYLDLQTGVTSSNGNTYLRSADSFHDTNTSGSWYAGVSFSYPLQNREAAGNLERQRQLLRITNAQLSRTFRQVTEQVQEALYNLSTAQKGIPVAKEALHAAQRTMNGEFERFEMGVVNNRDLLASHDALGREKISCLTSLANYRISLAEYEFATASILEKYFITVDKEQVRMR